MPAKTWSRLDTGLPEGDWGRIGVDVAADGKRVYAVIQAKKAGLYRSDDGGDTWTLENTDPRLTSRAWYFNSITIDPQNPDVIYIPNVALYRSVDGGKTISIVRGAPGGDDYHQIWIDPKNSDSMVLGTDQGTTISLDRGQTWSTWYNQPTAQLYHVITDNQFPYIVYGAQQDSGSAAVPSRTDHGQITPRDWFPAGGSESGYIAPDPNDPNIIYLSGSLRHRCPLQQADWIQPGCDSRGLCRHLVPRSMCANIGTLGLQFSFFLPLTPQRSIWGRNM